MATPSTAHPRQPRGQPTGGQFAAKSNPEANLELEPSWPGLVRRSQSYEDNSSVEWWSDANGQLQDPPDGTPAMCWRYSNSSVRSEEHYQAGQLQDPPDGSPAVRGLHLDGSVMYEQHWMNGRPQDPPDGTPVVRWFRQDGSIDRKEHWKAGRKISPRSV